MKTGRRPLWQDSTADRRATQPSKMDLPGTEQIPIGVFPVVLILIGHLPISQFRILLFRVVLLIRFSFLLFIVLFSVLPPSACSFII